MRDNIIINEQKTTDSQMDNVTLSGSSSTVRDEVESSIKDIYSFIHEKVEKLSTGLYMVTSYMSDSEPVRSSLRVLALSTVGHAAHMSMRHAQDRYHDLQKDIRHITSLLKLSQTLEIMSKMNSDILIAEYERLSQVLTHQKDTSENKKVNLHVLHEDTHYDRVRSAGNKIEGGLQSKLTLPHANTLPESKPREAHTTIDTHLSNTFSRLQKPAIATIKKSAIFPENKERRSKRQELVLQILSTDTAMTIGDVASRIKGCSEKTIQRELQELVDSKKVNRIGEKRWSKYIKV